MLSPSLAFRPASVVVRLPARSGACPLSIHDLLAPASAAGIVLPLVQAPIVGVARGALVAAKELGAAIGLSLAAGAPARAWFDGIAAAADELAAGLPIFLSADVVVEGEGATQVEGAAQLAWELVDAGLTHLAVDVAAIAVAERGRVAGEVAQAAFERGLGVEVVIPLGESEAGSRAAALFEELADRGRTPDLAGVRCPAPRDDEDARLQAGALARISQAVAGVPVMRRGPISPRLLELLRASPVKGCEDGGAAASRALGLVPAPAEAPAEGTSRESPLERAAGALSAEMADRLEARAYVETVDLLERLGAAGGAARIVRALDRARVDR